MSNLITKTTELAMHITRAYIHPGDTVVDATCGTGQDTLELARAAGPDGRVHAFDIQEEAIGRTADLLCGQGITFSINEEKAGNVILLHESFTSMGEYLEENSASAVVFNLGYLPGGDHAVTTVADATLEGLRLALRTICPGGVITVVLYDGHPEGREEKQRVLEWAESLDARHYHAAYVNLLNQANHPPEILWITKKRI